MPFLTYSTKDQMIKTRMRTLPDRVTCRSGKYRYYTCSTCARLGEDRLQGA